MNIFFPLKFIEISKVLHNLVDFILVWRKKNTQIMTIKFYILPSLTVLLLIYESSRLFILKISLKIDLTLIIQF